MAIEANFNKIVYLNRFNNYFNRKLLRGNSLKDYFYGPSGEDVNLSLTFGRNRLIDFDPENDCYLRGDLLNIPFGAEVSVLNVKINNGIGNLTWDEQWGYDYHKDTRRLFLKFDTTAQNLSDIPADIEIVISIYFRDRIYKIDENINFNPNDDITAEALTNDLLFHPDYLLVLDSENNIVSRWFILHDLRTRSGQYKLQLRRDIISDYLSEILASPVFVQKGMLEESDPFIVNSEGVSVNQIKTKETKLVDNSGVAWLACYIAKNAVENAYIDIMEPNIAVETFIYKDKITTIRQEFDYMVIPAGPITVIDKNGTEFVCDTETAFAMIAQMGRQLDASCYDIQLLPYCPVKEAITSEGKLDLRLIGSEHVEFEYLKTYVHAIYQKIYLDREDFGDPYLGLDGYYHLSKTYNYFELYWDTPEMFTVVSYTAEPATGNPTFTRFSQDDEEYVAIDIKCGTTLASVPTTIAFTFSYSKKQPAGIKKGIMLYCPDASFETNLKSIDGSIIGTTLNKKESSNLQLFRFCSPNYQGSFDINIAKNNNQLNDIRAFCTYKPYTPFIKVAPSFEFLYGSNFKDARGLICGGDFSLPRSTDAWETFQLNNKNYQNIFDREIQNMDFNFSIEQRNQYITGGIGIGTATLAGAGAGAVAGSIVPGIGTAIGAAVGAVAGAITSTAGMIVDSITMAEKYREQKQFAIDKFNYQLGNIKALPYTLTKVGAFDITSKVFAFVEQYDCTYEELEAFRQKIKFESMTVMRIDQMINYYNKFDELCYFKGELIRNDIIAADSHILAIIYEELLKGVYI